MIMNATSFLCAFRLFPFSFFFFFHTVVKIKLIKKSKRNQNNIIIDIDDVKSKKTHKMLLTRREYEPLSSVSDIGDGGGIADEDDGAAGKDWFGFDSAKGDGDGGRSIDGRIDDKDDGDVVISF